MQITLIFTVISWYDSFCETQQALTIDLQAAEQDEAWLNVSSQVHIIITTH